MPFGLGGLRPSPWPDRADPNLRRVPRSTCAAKKKKGARATAERTLGEVGLPIDEDEAVDKESDEEEEALPKPKTVAKPKPATAKAKVEGGGRGSGATKAPPHLNQGYAATGVHTRDNTQRGVRCRRRQSAPFPPVGSSAMRS